MYNSPDGKQFSFSKAVDHCLKNGYSKSDLSSSSGSCLLSLGNFGVVKDEEEKEATGDDLEEVISQSLALDSNRVTVTKLTNVPETRRQVVNQVEKQDNSVNDIGGLLRDKSTNSVGESVIWKFFRQGCYSTLMRVFITFL